MLEGGGVEAGLKLFFLICMFVICEFCKSIDDHKYVEKTRVA